MLSSLPYIVMSKLQIEVNIIGYKTIGESSVIFIKCDSNIVFSAVIDCYCYAGENKTLEILEQNGIEELDYVCWTHPDHDHSEGMVDIFAQFISKNTLINIPENVEAQQDKCSKQVMDLFQKLHDESKVNKHGYKIYTVSDMKDLLSYCDAIVFLHNNVRYELEMKSFAPNSNLVREEMIYHKFSKNTHSIALTMCFGGRVFMFTGDIENETIRRLNRSKMYHQVFFLKIPHHGSKSSDALFNYIDSIDHACVTAYKRGLSDLPDFEILDKYNDICKNIYMTSSKDVAKNISGSGIVTLSIDVINDTYEKSLHGNAVQYKPCMHKEY